MTDEIEQKLDRFIEELQAHIDDEASITFSEKAIAEFKDPHHAGSMEDPDGFAAFTGPCGDTMEIWLRIAAGRVQDSRFWTDGCGATIACGSMITRMIEGGEVGDVPSISEQDLIDALDGLPQANRHCAKLTIVTLRKALEDYRKRSTAQHQQDA